MSLSPRVVAALSAAVAFLAAAPAAALTEFARTPWQITATVSCEAGQCTFYFPKVGVNQRLDLKYLNCTAGVSGTAPQISAFQLGVDDALAKPYLQWYPDFITIGPGVVAQVAEPIVFSIPANHRPQIVWFYEIAFAPTCTLTGDLIFFR